ncbi:MAG: ABC transporter permease [Thermoleophilia bacterium]
MKVSMDSPGTYLETNLAPGSAFLESDAAGRRANLSSNRLLVAALLMVMGLVLIALSVPLLPLQDPIATDYDHMAEPPGAGHLLGTDLHGRDQLSRLLWASRTSLLVGVVAIGLALLVGIIAGGAAAYGGNLVDSFLMRMADIFLSFPIILGAIAIMAVLGPGRRNVFIAIAFFGWPVFARLFRSSVLSVKKLNYIAAARVLGASDARIFFRHVLPNSLTPLVSYGAMAVGGAILAEAGLSFINLGVQRPNPSWGLMLSESMGMFEQSPWLVIPPGVAITITVLIFILLGDAVTRALDPLNSGPGTR